MIFVTVGAQMPFDRLVHAVDAWAGRTGRQDVLAQVGQTAMRPAHLDWTPFLDPLEFRQRLFDAEIIITHAGMGTILTALELGRPVLVMPRRGDLRETRNDHQVGTARAFADSHRVSVAWDESELAAWLDRLEEVPAPSRVASHASPRLLSQLRQFIHGEEAAPAPRPLPATPPMLAPLPRGRRKAA